MQNRIMRVVVLFFFIILLPQIGRATESRLTLPFDSGTLTGVSYNLNSSTQNYFLTDTANLYIANSSGQLQTTATIGAATQLADVYYQSSTNRAYVLTSGGVVYEYNPSRKKISATVTLPVTLNGVAIVTTSSEAFTGITRAGSYFYIATGNKILEFSKNRNQWTLRKYWQSSSFNLSAMNYNSSDGTFYLLDADSDAMHMITLTALSGITSGGDIAAHTLAALIPATLAQGVTHNTDAILFAEDTGDIVSENLQTLLSDARQDELAGVNPPTDTSSNPIPIGFWGLNGYVSTDGLADISQRFSSTIFMVSSSSPSYTVNTLLPLVRASGMRVALNMTGWHDVYSTNGNFDLQKWKDKVVAWQNSGVQEFIDDGTVIAHMLIDDVDTFTGTDPTSADLDEMARYSKEIMPGLYTFVRQKASRMPVPADGSYDYLDACTNQYTNYQGYSDGDVTVYAATQAATASSLGLEIINGLNIADGGDGSSGQRGWGSNKYAMSAAEIIEYGSALLAVPNIKMFLMWEYDGQEVWSDGITIGSDYFDQPDIQQALKTLGEMAANGGE